MEDEKKTEEASDSENEEAEEEAEADESESEEDEVETEESEEDSKAEGEVDFDAELKKEQERLGKKIDKERNDKNELKKKFIPREEAEKLVNEKVAESERRILRDRAEELAGQLAGSEAEKKLILFHYDNSIVHTGNIKTDMENAHLFANRNRVKGTISELRKAAEHKKTLGGGSDAGAPAEQPKPKKKYSQDILDGAKFAGVSPEEFAKKQAEKER